MTKYEAAGRACLSTWVTAEAHMERCPGLLGQVLAAKAYSTGVAWLDLIIAAPKSSDNQDRLPIANDGFLS